jgi:hypothetical protein
MAFAFVGTIVATALTETRDIDRAQRNWYLRLLMISNLGLVLNLSVTLFSESRFFLKQKRILSQLMVTATSLGFLFSLNTMKHEVDYLRFLLLSIVFHLNPDHNSLFTYWKISGI